MRNIKREVLSDRQAISILVMFTIGTPMIYGVAKPAEENSWIALIIALLISIPFQLMYGRILSNFHPKGFFEILDIIFGRILGKIFAILFIWHAFYLSAILFRAVGEFLYVVGLDDTPEIFSLTLIILVCILTLKEGVRAFGKWCNFFIIIVLVSISFPPIFLYPMMKVDNIVPIAYDGVKPIIEGTLFALAFPFTQSMILLMVFDGLKNKKSCYSVFLKGVIYAGIFLLIVTLIDVSILGKSTYTHVYFPSYMTLRRLSIGDFFERVEMAVILIYMIVGFVKIVSCLFGAAKGISYLFKTEDYKFIAVPLAFFSGILGYLTYENTMDLSNFLRTVWTPYALIFQVFLITIVFIAGEIKIKNLKGHKKM